MQPSAQCFRVSARSLATRRTARLRWIILLASALAIAGLTRQPVAATGAYVWNFTSSVRVGLYRIDDRPWEKGHLVAVWPTGRLRASLTNAGVLQQDRLLLKRVAAIRGDEVCRDGEEVSVNGKTVAVARELRPGVSALPTWNGCRRLGEGQVFLLGDSADSFDGRYFGPSAADQIIGPISGVLTF